MRGCSRALTNTPRVQRSSAVAQNGALMPSAGMIITSAGMRHRGCLRRDPTPGSVLSYRLTGSVLVVYIL